MLVVQGEHFAPEAGDMMTGTLSGHQCSSYCVDEAATRLQPRQSPYPAGLPAWLSRPEASPRGSSRPQTAASRGFRAKQTLSVHSLIGLCAAHRACVCGDRPDSATAVL